MKAVNRSCLEISTVRSCKAFAKLERKTCVGGNWNQRIGSCMQRQATEYLKNFQIVESAQYRNNELH